VYRYRQPVMFPPFPSAFPYYVSHPWPMQQSLPYYSYHSMWQPPSFSPYPTPYPKPHSPAKQQAPGWQSIMSQFKTQDGTFDINKMMNTMGQMVNAVNQVSAMIKGLSQTFKT
jgi:hypothetical protein